MSDSGVKGEVRRWRLLPPVGHALASRTHAAATGAASPASPPSRVTIVAAEDRSAIALLLPGPRFCPESAARLAT
jgi:hypothetical protein